MFLDYVSTALVTLLVILDPVALAPIFISLTQGMTADERKRVAIRSSLIAFFILAFFGLGGEILLRLLGVGIPAFRISGGLLLFWIAFEMVFERRNERKQHTADIAITEDHIRNVAAFPLAIPLMAGPGAITAVILLAGRADGNVGYLAALITLIALGVLSCFVVYLTAGRVARWLGVTGNIVLSRLLGVILAGLAVQFIINGVTDIVTSTRP
ncbi:MarC family protein [Microvirga pudoricolor]|uniref:MarC family protein n=1 Tax=Microvirga pudoricolor TaxID=2778729 RepID=UPI0019501AFE|nr:MarC family protein [Microvirga pudoricolor]MBM6596350.1 MarC family protein [Microvirga pudoricolor]